MKITEINSEQWEINESGTGAIFAGAVTILGGCGLLIWVITHLATTAWWWVLIAVGILALGGLMIFTASKRQIVLRKHGVNDIVKTTIIGGKETRLSFDASQIASINLDTSDQLSTRTDSSGDKTTTRERTSLLYVQLRDNNQVMLASQKGGNNGISINGMNMSGLTKAPLSDEAKRIAAFYGVPLSSRMNNVDSLEAITGVISAVKEGITGTQQTAPANIQPEPQPVTSTTPMQTTAPIVAPAQPVIPPIVAPVQSVPPVMTSVQNTSALDQVVASEPANSTDQLPR